MIFFIIGFVCANSGWAPALSIMLSDRPDWSVCGEDLCLCVKPTQAEPFCPLCIESDEQASCLSTDGSEPRTPPKRVPRNPHADAISQAGQLGSVGVFIAFVFGIRHSDVSAADTNVLRFADPDQRVALNQPDIPTPPPRS
ncbi:MAG: hypothetical protein ACF8LL_02285 [Phycisphaerales bacterium]